VKTSNNPYAEMDREALVKEIRKRTSGARPTKHQETTTPNEKLIQFLVAWDELGPTKKASTGGGDEPGPVKRFGENAFKFVTQELKGEFSLERREGIDGLVVVNGDSAYQLQVNPAGAYSLKAI
jgi:hypothetical protein